MRFRPCIDLHNGKVKQIVGSSLSDEDNAALITNFETEQPASFFAHLYKKDNLHGGHVIMLGPGNKRAAKDALQAFPDGLQVGGGITPENAQDFLDYGASHIVVTSFAFKNGQIYWDNLTKLRQQVGKNRIVLDISCKKRDCAYYIVTDRWQKYTSEIISEENVEKLSSFCDEFLVHAADVEGKRKGIDTELIRLLAGISPIPVTYAGGVSSMEDLETINSVACGTMDVTIGSALDIFGGCLKYTDVVSWHRRHNEIG